MIARLLNIGVETYDLSIIRLKHPAGIEKSGPTFKLSFEVGPFPVQLRLAPNMIG